MSRSKYSLTIILGHCILTVATLGTVDAFAKRIPIGKSALLLSVSLLELSTTSSKTSHPKTSRLFIINVTMSNTIQQY